MQNLVYIKILISLILSFSTLFILKKYKYFSKKYNFIDRPNKNIKIHKFPISNIGGTACLIGFLPALILSYYFEDFFSNMFLLIIFFSSLAFYTLGRLDDIKNLPPNRKFLVFSLIFFFLFPLDPDLLVNTIRFRTIDFAYVLINKYYIAIFFTLFCLFIFYNSANFIDGANGIYGTTALFWILFLIFKTGLSSILVFTLIFSLLFFLFFNLKNQVFIGNSGNSFITCLISCLYIYSYNITNNKIFCDDIFFAFLIPGLETIRLSFQRVFKGKSPFHGDNNHLHHLLIKKYKFLPIWILNLLIVISPSIFFEISKNFYKTVFFAFLFYSIVIYFLKFKKKPKFY
tara:strand:+ start:210 stop:1241 length:1032 start_codon:yes stop_codon:yes gene_type:complete